MKKSKKMLVIILLLLIAVNGLLYFYRKELDGHVISGWGDNAGGRPSYTEEEVQSGILGDSIVLNSISDGAIGDEKNFVGARLDTGTDAGLDNVWNRNEITAKNGETYIVRAYIRNNSILGYDGLSQNTKVAFGIPLDSAKEQAIHGLIYSDNATPSEYWDGVLFKSDTPFHFEYIYGSALLENNGIGANGGIQLSDEIVTKADEHGVQIGYDKLDGKLPGGIGYDCFVSFKVMVVYDVDYTVHQQVRLEGTKEWSDHVDAKVGDRVEFRIEYRNTSTKGEKQDNVTIKDILPKNLRYVPDSTKFWNPEYTAATITPDGDIVTCGITIGNYYPDTNAFIRFSAEVVDEDLAIGSNTLVNWSQCGVGDVTIQDYACVEVQKE